MITNKFSVFTKKQSILLKIVNSIQIIISVLLIVVAIISSFPQWNGKIDLSYILALVMGVTGAISLFELIAKTVSNRKTFAYSLLLKIYKKKPPLFPPTQIQTEVCSWANKSIQEGRSILLYGKVNAGKTTSIFIYLSQYIKNKEILKNLEWVENVLYIDCKSNKSDILDFFDERKFFIKNQTYEKSLIIIDNIETMGEAFCNQLLNVIKSSISTFILLADVCNVDIQNHNTIESKEVEEKFSIKIYKKYMDTFKNIYENLDYQDKIILLTIYYISMSVTLIPIRNILAVWDTDLPHHQIRRRLKSLMRHDMIKEFPFDNSYILLVSQKTIFENQGIFWETPENTEVIMKIIKNSNSFPESAWLSFIHLPYEKQLQLNRFKKDELFFNALKCGNYLTLSKALQEELIYSPNKESLFHYEMGTLYFYNSQQEKAFTKYNNLLQNILNTDQEMILTLKIIETTHGDITQLTRVNINKYLEKLKEKGIPYSLYAQYWKLHIDSERGKFDLCAYNQLLTDLSEIEIEYSTDVHLEIIKRCYTDVIRICHILFIVPEKKLISHFLGFLEKHYSDTTCRYYEALYVNANFEHYIRLLGKILKGENCESTYYQAASNYEMAIKIGYQNLKSVSACELKDIDLKLFVPENLENFDQYKDKINKFLTNAEINRVSVHVAYCKTLLAKLCMIKNLNDEEYYRLFEKERKIKDSYIKEYISDAKKIYRDFENDYGIVRIEFLEFLYYIATCNNNANRNIFLQKITGILEKYSEYRRENIIINSLKSNSDISSRMFAISLVKAYPIIMQ